MSVSEHEHMYTQRRNLTWYLIIVFFTAGKASLFSRSFINFNFLFMHTIKQIVLNFQLLYGRLMIFLP